MYRGLGIEPILDERGELDRVLVGQWPLFSSSLRAII